MIACVKYINFHYHEYNVLVRRAKRVKKTICKLFYISLQDGFDPSTLRLTAARSTN